MRTASHKGDLACFRKVDYVLVAHEHFHKNEKLCIPWRGPRCVAKCLNGYVFQVEDVCIGALETIHVTRLSFNCDISQDDDTIPSHVLASETVMPVFRRLRLVEQDGKVSSVSVGKN